MLAPMKDSSSPEPARKEFPAARVMLAAPDQQLGDNLADLLAEDEACELTLLEAIGAAEAMETLRNEPVGAVLVQHTTEFDAFELIDAVRAGQGDDLPILVLGEQCPSMIEAACFEAGADGYLCMATTSARALLWHVAKAIERSQLLGGHRRLTLDQHRRLSREHGEASDLLQQQRMLIQGLEQVQAQPSEAPAPPTQLVEHYRELLRAHVIMGTGALGADLRLFCDLLVQAGFGPADAMSLHVSALEQLVQGLGGRSARHVMNRADLLVLELMMGLADCYRAPQP